MKNKIIKASLIGYLVFLTICSCTNEDKMNNDISVTKPKKETDTAMIAINEVLDQSDLEKTKYNVINRGDSNSYYRLRIYYLDYPSEYFLYTALHTASKYKLPIAFYDVYSCIEMAYSPGEKLSQKKIGDQLYNIAINHLLEGAKLGDTNCIKKINVLYPEKSKLTEKPKSD